MTRYIEMKTEIGVLSLEQRGVRRRVSKHNFAVCHVYPHTPGRTWAEFKAALDVWMVPLGLRWLTDTESVQRAAFKARSAA
jgi:hypothetical protein